MANLYDYLVSSEPLQGRVSNTQEFEPHHDEAIAVDMLTPTLEFALGLKGISNAYNTYKGIKPFLGDIWQGRNLWLRKPYNWMNKTEQKQYANDGKNYFKNCLVNNPVDTIIGEVNFKGNRAKETPAKYMWQYPFARYNLSRAKKNTPFPNKKEQRVDASKFDNLEINMFGKKYDYQIRNNLNDNSKDMYNIKPYEFLNNDIEKLKLENPNLYQKFLKMQK